MDMLNFRASRLRRQAALLFALLGGAAAGAQLAALAGSPQLSWVQQFGASQLAEAHALELDEAENVYVVGVLDWEGFVTKFDSNGGQIWLRRLFGTSQAFGVGVDAAGSVFIAGQADGAGFLVNCDSDGNELWRQYFDGPAYGLVLDSAGNVYVGGSGAGAYLRKYDSTGTELWTRELAVLGSETLTVTRDALGNVYLGGYLPPLTALPGQTPSGGRDGFVQKYDLDGNELWARQFGPSTSNDGLGLAVDNLGNVYVVSYTPEALPGQVSAGDSDVFVRKYDINGTEQWTRQFGSPAFDIAFAAVLDASGNLFVAGQTDGDLPGQTSSGAPDAFVRKYSPDGTELWTLQFGTSGLDIAEDAAISLPGDLYLVGVTDGVFPGTYDAFLAKFSQSLDVAIDVRPGSFPNTINLGSGGTVPVAVFSTVTFDARTVDPTTVTLASAPVRLKGKGTPMASFEDVDRDGLLDLIVHVETESFQLSQTDTQAVLEGRSFGGVPIRGSDTVRIVR